MPGTTLGADKLVVADMVPPGHKLKSGAAVRRYNQIIGFATTDISAGQHVHSHNLGMGEF